MSEKPTIYAPGVIKTRRRAVGMSLIGIRNILRNQHEVGLGLMLERDLDFLDDKEKAAIEKIRVTLESCEKNLTVLARKNGLSEKEAG